MRDRTFADNPFVASVPSTNGTEPKTPRIEFLSPKQIVSYEVPEGAILVGDCHIAKGSITVIAGPPGVGKSRAIIALAEAGSTKYEWFGLPVHVHFKILVIQNENGRRRLKHELLELDVEKLNDFLRISPPPPGGIALDDPEFCTELKQAIDEFKPDIVVIDPWNAAATDEKLRNYRETLNLLRSIVPPADDGPAIIIIAHIRKPYPGERASGRALLNLVAGSYILGSVPRTVFVMQPASDDVTDDRIVWTCCKNNDGDLGKRSAWKRCNGLFDSVLDFEWETFDNPDTGKESGITEFQIRTVFDAGALKRSEAVTRLIALTGRKKSQCYEALKIDGKFSGHLNEEDGKLCWID